MLAGKEQPRTEQEIRKIGLQQREEQVVDLVREADHVPGVVERIPRIPGLDREARDYFRQRSVGCGIVDHFDTFPEKCDRRPGGHCEHCKADDEHEQLPHLCEGQSSVPSIRLCEQRVCVGLVPNVQRHVEIVGGQGEEEELH